MHWADLPTVSQWGDHIVSGTQRVTPPLYREWAEALPDVTRVSIISHVPLKQKEHKHIPDWLIVETDRVSVDMAVVISEHTPCYAMYKALVQAMAWPISVKTSQRRLQSWDPPPWQAQIYYKLIFWHTKTVWCSQHEMYSSRRNVLKLRTHLQTPAHCKTLKVEIKYATTGAQTVLSLPIIFPLIMNVSMLDGNANIKNHLSTTVLEW